MIHSDFLIRFFRAQPVDTAEGWVAIALSFAATWFVAYVFSVAIDAIEERRARRSSERRKARELQRREELGRLEAERRRADQHFARAVRTGATWPGYAVDREDRR